MQVEIEHIFIVMAPIDKPVEGGYTLSAIRCSIVVQRFTPQYIKHPPRGVFGFPMLCSGQSVSDTRLVWILGFKFKPSKIPLLY